ncbi:S10 family peptidase [Phenylobacterium sp.]|jgi:carboxypeptidase C (cathepsin A)|uniref:S10 family peptidase n=1 Tax=Phenylobacterium sp. TaxID=1871053 RepID=UPI002F40C776
MRSILALLSAAVAAGAIVAGHAGAQPAAGEAAGMAVSQHRGVFGGKAVSYAAKAGDLVVTGADNVPIARIFSTAYLADGASAARRPVIFAYNGGPGTASAFLHMGALGPMRAVFPTDLTAPPPSPVRLAPNPDAPLDVADVVLIDPPETGFSHTLPGDAKKSYATILGDAEIMADFIRAWVWANGREASPKYVLGESYGATRTALVTGDLLKTAGGRPATHLAGVILVSQMLTVDDLGPRPMNAAGAAMGLPSIAAVAWYHGRVPHRGRTMGAFLAEVRRFAIQQYLPALTQGRDLPRAERARIAARVAAYSGLPAAFILDHDLKLDVETYRRAFAPGQLLGGYDGRYVGPPAKPGEGAIVDPAQRQTTPIVEAAIGDYLRHGLGVTRQDPYVLENHALAGAWYFGDKRRASATTYLTDYIAKEPDAEIMIAGGYDDLVTPFATGVFLASHLPVKPGHATFHAYPGGHMFYSDAASLSAFARDLRAFVERTSAVAE